MLPTKEPRTVQLAAFSGVLIDYSIHEAIRITRELGFDGLEIACREPHLSPGTSLPRVREIRRLADDAGLALPVLAGYAGGFSAASDADCERALEDIRRLFDHAGELGATMVRVQPGGPNAFLAEDYHFAKAAFWLNRCAEEAEAHGIRIVLEIHNNSLVETVDSCMRLRGMIPAANLGFIHDAGNMYITDTDYGRSSVLRLGGSLLHVHVKDERRLMELGAPGSFANRTHRGEEYFLGCRLGEGEADHQPLFDALAETGYAGWITLETHAPFDPRERLAYDLAAARRMLQLTAARS
ncbi:hypothetical protein J31TS4_21100 [Paenibacillus sp. J31TS4]|uniref:sugar phosphate isomerase/epimerase family protein n=1 Tax=Paenibacillus sp. J31TS4 TaxID=2807195 RepID=UPI001B128775|nr:sugar phosphate isomerase/epimerase family protein [Paenibacillus sp. J31TS4]GIP38830.1 hypothetical protein J31TS4_21100 [Paenibacillus sp. J31TS4]